MSNIASIILAGGEGKRLQPLTRSRCKPALPFAGGGRLIDIPVSHCLHAQINNIFILYQYLPKTLEEHIEQNYFSHGFCKASITLLSPRSTEASDIFLGTADAIRKRWKEIEKVDAEYLLILSGDQLYNIDFSQMIAAACRSDADLLIACLPVKEQDAHRMGLLRLDREGRVEDFAEKPKDPEVLQRFCKGKEEKPFLASMGIYIFKKAALGRLLEKPGDDFGHELIPLQMKMGRCYGYIYDGYWEDIGTVDAFYSANIAMAEPAKAPFTLLKTPPIRHLQERSLDAKIENSKIEGSLISAQTLIKARRISRSVIGPSTEIQQGCIIDASVILGETVIGRNSCIHKAIIDERAVIGSNVHLTNLEQRTHFDGNGIYIRDGIIVVPSGTNVPDGYKL